MTLKRSTFHVLAALTAILACAEPPLSAPNADGLLLAKGGGGGSSSDPAAAFHISSEPGLGIRGMPAGALGTRYADGECGVQSKIFATATAQAGDAIMYTDNPKTADRKCVHYPRTVSVVLTPAAGDQATVTVKLNLNELHGAGFEIAQDATVLRNLAVELAWTRCARLYYGASGRQPNAVGSDQVHVTRTGPRTWRVEAFAGQADAWCSSDGKLYDVPVQFTIESLGEIS